jgi:hypothetical protein
MAPDAPVSSAKTVLFVFYCYLFLWVYDWLIGHDVSDLATLRVQNWFHAREGDWCSFGEI